MAKALFGHVGGPDPRMISEMRRLQQRVRDLEAELVRLQEENESLTVEAARPDMLVPDREPALAERRSARKTTKTNQGRQPWRPSSLLFPRDMPLTRLVMGCPA